MTCSIREGTLGYETVALFRNGFDVRMLAGLLAEYLPKQGDVLRKVATSSVVEGYDFPVVWACREEEWRAAQAEGREPESLPWPAETVTVA